MSLPQTVTFVTFVLLSGFYQFTSASPRLRLFDYVSNNTVWAVARNECLKRGASLATVYDDEDVRSVKKLYSLSNSGIWVGLRKTRVHYRTWSDGAPYIFTNSSQTEDDKRQICEAIVNGTWTGYNCSEKMDFMCSQGTSYRLIEGNQKNWCQAQQYCRTHFSDLVSITDETENQEVINEGQNKTFWIGLMHDKWEWEDGTCSTYREWSARGSQSVQGKKCSVLQENNMQTMECDFNNKEGLCSKGSVRIITVNETYSWEEALNYCETHHTGLLWIRDEHDNQTVAQHLNATDVLGPFWIGLRQSTLFGFWIWKDRVVTVHNWANGTIPVPPMSHHCAVTNTNNTWTDQDCNSKNHVLCEEEVFFNNK